jgi:hypothetical protein
MRAPTTYCLWVASLFCSNVSRFAFLVVFVGGTAAAHAETINDGYCDYVQGVASAEAALLRSPVAFGEFGRIEQTSTTAAQDVGQLRLIAGLRYNFIGIVEGGATTDRAAADCRRHQALEGIRGQTQYRAVAARLKIIDDALPEADKVLAGVTADLEARRTTVPEATAMRLRVEELHRISSDAHQQLASLPAPAGAISGLATFQRADDDVEKYDGKIRRARALDVSVRVGYQSFLDQETTSSPYFAVVSVGVNLGVLLQGSANDRAAAGRRTYVRSGRDPLSMDATADRLKALLDDATKRAQETATLEQDLARQMAALEKLGSDEAKRYRQVVWFDWTKVRAEHAYHEAYVAALQQVLGAQ